MDILVVDDSRFSRAVLRATLEGAGHAVHCAADGEQAVLLLCATEIDVVITDFRMPRLGGLELTTIIRRLFGERISVIGVSASDDCRQRFVKAGVDAYLEKPIEEKPLLRLIQQFSGEIACPTNTNTAH